jgi:hypothetical protein
VTRRKGEITRADRKAQLATSCGAPGRKGVHELRAKTSGERNEQSDTNRQRLFVASVQ